MRIMYGVLAMLWGGTFIAFLYGYEPGGFLVGGMFVLVTLNCLIEALAGRSTELRSFELSESKMTLGDDTFYNAEVKKSDGTMKTFHGYTAEEAREKAMKYIEKESK